jgi:hypothetical protein
MKNSNKLLLISIIFLQSCSFFNKHTAEVKIASNPSGALILVEGRSMGRTPAVIELPPKKYSITLQKEGYGSAIFETESWASIKTRADNSVTSDGVRCLFDSLNPFLFFNVFLKNCRDFKKKVYEINITQTQDYNGYQPNSSLIGIGNIPQNMIYYNYHESNPNYQSQQMQPQPQMQPQMQQQQQPQMQLIPQQ